MSELAEIITGEFTDAVEVKNPESLKRGIFLLLSSTVKKEEHAAEHEGLKEAVNSLGKNVELIALRMEEGFKRMDERFEAMDKRFEAVDRRFEAMQEQMNQRFEAVDKRFESIQKQMNRRFDSVDKRFNRLTALMSVGFVVITTLITIYRFLG